MLAICCVMMVTACNRPTERSKTVAADTVAVDSSAWLMEQVDHYYKNVEHDSLATLTPIAMDFFSRNRQWQQYYTAWCLYVNDLVWNGQMDQGFAEARKMHEDAIKRNNAFGLSEAYTAMGIAYHFQKNNSESARCYQQALKHYPKNADQTVKLNIYSYYCQVLVDAKDFQTMGDVLAEWKAFLDHLTDGKDDTKENAHKYFRFHRENYKYHFGLGRYRLASIELDQMKHYLELETDCEMYEAQVAGFRTQLAMARKDYNEAMSWSDVEIDLCRDQDFNTFLNALKHRTEVLQTLGHYKEALRAYNDYDRQKDSIIKADSRQQLNELNKRFEVDELKAQQERSELEHDRELLQIYLFATVAAIFLLMLFIYVRHRAAHRLKKAHAMLEQSNEELQQSYEKLKVANAKAEESSKMKTNFIQQISHEIRTPLNILSGFTQVVTTPGLDLDDEERQDINRQINENTNRITSLVNKMLELSDANSQATIQRTDQVSASQIVMQAIEASAINRAQHLTFIVLMGDEAEETLLTTNLRQASRALTQILDNARKFTKQGTVRILTTISSKTVNFIVEDTGIGVPASEADHIFEEFVQLDEYYDGTGIGLTVARSIARRLGGDVILDKTYSPGSRFIMRLPRT